MPSDKTGVILTLRCNLRQGKKKKPTQKTRVRIADGGLEISIFLAVVVPNLTAWFTQGRAVCSFQIAPFVLGGSEVQLRTGMSMGLGRCYLGPYLSADSTVRDGRASRSCGPIALSGWHLRPGDAMELILQGIIVPPRDTAELQPRDITGNKLGQGDEMSGKVRQEQGEGWGGKSWSRRDEDGFWVKGWSRSSIKGGEDGFWEVGLEQEQQQGDEDGFWG